MISQYYFSYDYDDVRDSDSDSDSDRWQVTSDRWLPLDSKTTNHSFVKLIFSLLNIVISCILTFHGSSFDKRQLIVSLKN